MIKNLFVQEAHQQQAAGSIYLDVRSIPEFEMGHPAGAYNIPLLHLDERTRQMRPNAEFVDVVRANFPPDTPLLVACQAGARSVQACQILESVGYTNLANVRALNAIAQRRGQSLAQMAIAWVLKRPVVTSALIGASRWEQIEDCLGALRNTQFSKSELDEIDRHAADGNLNIWARSSQSG